MDSHLTYLPPTTRRIRAPRPSLRPRDGWSSDATTGSTRLSGWIGSRNPFPGYPARPVPRDDEAAKSLKKRTLTNLYNARPQWLQDAHAQLDAAAAAYGWPSHVFR